MKSGRKIFIAGTGKSGISAAKMVLSMGGEVILYNSDPETDEYEVMANFGPRDAVEFVKGRLYKSQIMGVNLAIMSPGIPLNADFISVLDQEQIPVIGELELAYQASKGKLCAITGTNGKTTTTALVGAILRTYFEDVHVAGNIGDPFSADHPPRICRHQLRRRQQIRASAPRTAGKAGPIHARRSHLRDGGRRKHRAEDRQGGGGLRDELLHLRRERRSGDSPRPVGKLCGFFQTFLPFRPKVPALRCPDLNHSRV